jgi:hypothetical protein
MHIKYYGVIEIKKIMETLKLRELKTTKITIRIKESKFPSVGRLF